ncbi:MAG: hypothetical protein KAX49_03785 [Halanaerobiales bacterium]|nr:hypothetical protein [Halanaerobiales bacterium]
MSDIKELKVEIIEHVKAIWIDSFEQTNIPVPDFKIKLETETKFLADRIILSCYLPSSLISKEASETVEEYLYYPINLFNYIKMVIKNKLPTLLSKHIKVNNEEIAVRKRVTINNIGVHPSHFDIKSSSSKIYYVSSGNKRKEGE